MDPTTTFCPNAACPARGQIAPGNIRLHSRQDKRFLCPECHKPCSATTGTVFYRRRTAAETVALVVTLRAHGCPVQAMVAAFGCAERTVADWWARSGRQGQAVQEPLVEPPRDLGQVQADEIGVKQQGGLVWMARAMMVKTRLWLGGEVSEQRERLLLRRLIARVRRCAAHRPLLIGTDGLVSYIRAIRETLRDPVPTGTGDGPGGGRGAMSSSPKWSSAPSGDVWSRPNDALSLAPRHALSRSGGVRRATASSIQPPSSGSTRRFVRVWPR